MVVPYVGTWIEISIFRNRSRSSKSRSLRGNVDRNRKLLRTYSSSSRRSLRGNVDRNTFDGTRKTANVKVVPYVGTWIEIRLSPRL